MNEEKAILEHIKQALEYYEDTPMTSSVTEEQYARDNELTEKALSYINFKLNILNLFLP